MPNIASKWIVEWTQNDESRKREFNNEKEADSLYAELAKNTEKNRYIRMRREDMTEEEHSKSATPWTHKTWRQ